MLSLCKLLLPGTLLFGAVLAGCSSVKEPQLGDIKGTNVPKLDPNYVRAKMADAMGKMNAAGGIKKIDPNH